MGANGDLPRAKCSVIIPCWNDGEALQFLLARMARMRGVDQVVVVDASAGEDCAACGRAMGALVVKSAPSRGVQLNLGAQHADGDIFLFQHADSDLTQAHLDALHRAMEQSDVVGGAFHRQFDRRHAKLRFLAPIARAWAHRGGTLYGDQSIFVRRAVFERLGGFAEIPLMEDVEFSPRLRRAGRTVVLDPPMASSPRHHLRRGALRTSLRNGVMIALFRAGYPAQKLHAWYYRSPE
ncbi:MAG TPA: TIGR04283 family arsenosugar biosynthesis glycosyltransferase [Chthoniobacteraceae bacterium]|nr:TIGR04283 family arsenosugar biosynthesis glycosyltransferase [Chthoniobacteraceae bacterium]